MAISSYKTFLMRQSGTSWSKLVDIKDYPDLGGAPEMLETTTLSDGIKTFIPGIQGTDSLDFRTNYTKADYDTLKALEGSSMKFAVWFGATVSNGVATPTGSDGKYEFEGQLSVYIVGGGVNEVVNMTISIARSTAITVPAS